MCENVVTFISKSDEVVAIKSEKIVNSFNKHNTKRLLNVLKYISLLLRKLLSLLTIIDKSFKTI